MENTISEEQISFIIDQINFIDKECEGECDECFATLPCWDKDAYRQYKKLIKEKNKMSINCGICIKRSKCKNKYSQQKGTTLVSCESFKKDVKLANELKCKEQEYHRKDFARRHPDTDFDKYNTRGTLDSPNGL